MPSWGLNLSPCFVAKKWTINQKLKSNACFRQANFVSKMQLHFPLNASTNKINLISSDVDKNRCETLFLGGNLVQGLLNIISK